MLKVIELPDDAARRPSRDARYGAKSPEIGPMAYSAPGGFAVAAGGDQPLTLRDAADRHIRYEFGSGISGFELFQILWHLDDALANRLFIAVIDGGKEPTGDIGLRDHARFRDRDHFFRLEAGKVDCCRQHL